MTYMNSDAGEFSTHNAVLGRIDALSREELEARFAWLPPTIDTDAKSARYEIGQRERMSATLLISSISAVVIGVCMAVKHWSK